MHKVLSDPCVILTHGQWYADWFILRPFSVAGTSAGKILLQNGFKGENQNYTTNASVEE